MLQRRVYSVTKLFVASVKSKQATYYSAQTSNADVKPFEDIPGPKGKALWPGVGAAMLFKPFGKYEPSRVDLMTRDLHKLYGDIVKIRLPFGFTVLVKDPNDMLTVFQNEGKYPSRPNFDIVDTFMKANKIETLSTMNGEDWKRLRSRVQPKMMRPSAPEPFLPVMNEVADDFVELLVTAKNPDDFRDITFNYIVESIGQFCFNRRLGALSVTQRKEDMEVIKAVKDLFAVLASPPNLPVYKLWKTKQYNTVERNMTFLMKKAETEVYNSVSEAKKISEDGRFEKGCPHLIHSMMEGNDLTEKEIAMAMGEFFFGGTDSTSRMLGLLFYHTASNPGQQELLYKEIKEIVGEGPVEKQQLAKMKLIKAFVNESLRMVFPIAPGPPRFAPHDLVLSGYKVPKGTLLMLSNDAYLHDPSHLTDPEVFRPQRWLRNEEGGKDETPPRVAFLPFGIGARMCLGKRFAEQMMYLGLIKVVQNYQISLQDTESITVKYEVFPTLSPYPKFLLTKRG